MEKYSWIKQENTEQGEAFTCIQFEQSYTVKEYLIAATY